MRGPASLFVSNWLYEVESTWDAPVSGEQLKTLQTKRVAGPKREHGHIPL